VDFKARLDLEIKNTTLKAVSSFDGLFNKNSFGLLVESCSGVESILPKQTGKISIHVMLGGQPTLSTPLNSRSYYLIMVSQCQKLI
jgi:hypothetical protein